MSIASWPAWVHSRTILSGVSRPPCSNPAESMQEKAHESGICSMKCVGFVLAGCSSPANDIARLFISVINKWFTSAENEHVIFFSMGRMVWIKKKLFLESEIEDGGVGAPIHRCKCLILWSRVPQYMYIYDYSCLRHDHLWRGHPYSIFVLVGSRTEVSV